MVASLQRFPAAHGGLRGFSEELPAETCETSWMAPRDVKSSRRLADPGSSVYIYTRDTTAGGLLVRRDDAWQWTAAAGDPTGTCV